MNVVLLPAWASTLIPAIADGPLCFEGPCLLGWIWSMLALTFASAWVVHRWTSGSDNDDLALRFAPVAGVNGRAAVQPRVSAIASPTDLAMQVRRRRTDLASSGHALRGPPATDMLSPACLPNRSTGTPTETPGRTPPA